MILKGSQRAGAKALADHLMNDRDNDHVTVLEVSGFMADDLHGALSEAYAISNATQCTQFMFSLSLNPPQDHVGSEQDFLDAADRAENALGLTGQPRAIIMHEKEGRRHAHVVWSRIDGDAMKAINLPHFKNKLTSLSRELYLDHGWVLPEGLQTHGGKSPLNFSLAEWQQAKRIGLDPREIKQVFRDAWERSDNIKSLSNALQERGYFLAKGDRRGFVAVDVNGAIYSLPKWIGEKSKAVTQKLGSPDGLSSVSDVRADIKSRVTDQLKSYIAETRSKHARDAQPLLEQKAEMVSKHRAERKALKDGQEKRWKEETKARLSRLNGGLRGLFDRITGKNSKTKDQIEAEAYQAAKRDQAQRDDLVLAQSKDRKVLQVQFVALRSKQKEDRKILARSISQFMTQRKRNQNRGLQKGLDVMPELRRSRGPDLSL
ncbi:relaxase/mobilization nuclease domain-containing protein [Roseobacter sp. GAI101]|uniref:relaxase/mobilization nuclease domain-containing protein n=1 Tax=Roseobacter sp. (strain GAI101) TaxID=391589 RepID=UPI000187161C|nr:relaxase/mobilization nuclease domain-containing protein [Roseobacter sp. GAI101]EEB84111.1 relaxase/mobilization nuclease domain protein [Roseobacter sp. GAI101]